MKMDDDFVFNGIIANENGIIQFRDSESVLCELERNGTKETIPLEKLYCIERGFIGEDEWMHHWLIFVDAENYFS